jgi:hypothetical protein
MCASDVVSPFFLFDSSTKKEEIVEGIKMKAKFFLFDCSTLVVLNYPNRA